MKNQMNCIQSDPYQQTLHIKVKQTQRLLLGVGILLTLYYCLASSILIAICE